MWSLATTAFFTVAPPAQLQAQTAPAPATAGRLDINNASFAIPMEGFFPGLMRGGAKKRLNAYLVRRDGKWLSGIGTPTNNGKPSWNGALMMIDPSGLSITETGITGQMLVTLVPDSWIPADQKARIATVKLNAAFAPSTNPASQAAITGTWQATIPGTATELAAATLQGSGEGPLSGSASGTGPNDTANVSYDLALYNIIPGQVDGNYHRRRALSLGVRAGKVISVRLGQIDMRAKTFDFKAFDPPQNFEVTGDSMSGAVSFEAATIEGEPARFNINLEGRRVVNWVAGTWKGTYTGADNKAHEISGFFRGDVRPGAVVAEVAKADDRPWFVQTPGVKPFAPGEHPRLFFRKADVPELQRRAATPEGQQIVKRLRQLLNGSDGETMTTRLSPATKAYDGSAAVKAFGKQGVQGAYTIAHGAGYGFLYQLTGNKKYADFARQCVELGFKGQRDHDSRYAWVAPGGELRAGPSVGWTAVAYDLCYDAWPADFRQKVALEIQNYADKLGGEWNKPEGITLRKMALTPKQGPGSNHYGSVLGGTGLAVLAIQDDPGTDKELLDGYAKTLERGIVNHITAGWGDGGYFKEGWGGSRVGTQSTFLPFMQAVKVATGRDYLNADHTNASYITMVPRSLLMLGPGAAYFPYRSQLGPTYGNAEIGSYGENDSFSQGGYFSEGFGAVADKYKPGLLWTYNHIFSPGNKYGFDTASAYP